MDKPSVGRIVHYVAYGTPGGEFPAGVCRAAIVTEVASLKMGGADDIVVDAHGAVTTIGICVTNPTGLFFNRGIQYDDPFDDGKGGRRTQPVVKPGTWHWPERV